MPQPSTVRRLIYVIGCLAPAWAAVTVICDGVALHLGPVRISSTEPLRPLFVGVGAWAWYLWSSSRAEMDRDGAWLSMWLRRAARMSVPIVVVLGCVIGIMYGTFAAAGSDAYGYVSQAALWLHGDLRIEQPIASEVSWPDATWTFTPLGYRPSSDLGTIVPTYAPGLPMLMAVFQAVAGTDGPFYVVPLLGSAALAGTYALGRAATGSRSVGALATLLLLASPTFLAHVMVPMTDVPVTAAWTLALVLALRQPARPALSGLVAGLALVIRPNLLLLAGAPVLAWLWAGNRTPTVRRTTLRSVGAFGAAFVPSLLVIAGINNVLYGSPFESSYGRLSDLYGIGAASQNLRNYYLWLIETQTPLVALALVPLCARSALRPREGPSSARAGLAAMLVLVFLSYVFYAPFENWTYLRFLLPAFPAMFVLMAAVVRFFASKLPLPVQAPAVVLFVAVSVPFGVQFARDQFVFNWRDHERRYVHAGARAAELTPESAVLFSSQHSGSLRYYTGRLTLRYDLLQMGSLDTAIRELNGKGRRSFLVIDEWERADFRNRFASSTPTGALDWAPLARVSGQPDVFIYDLTDRPR